MHSYRVMALALLCLSAAACAGPRMTRVDPTADDTVGGTGIDSADVIAITDRAANDLSRVLLQSPKGNLVVAVGTIRNESRQPFNTALLTDRMSDQILHGTAPRVRLRATEHLDDVLRERDAKRTGVYSATERKNIVGADYLLSGRIASLSKRHEGDAADYFQLGFRLLDAEDGTVVWSNQYEFKKQGEAGTIYQ